MELRSKSGIYLPFIFKNDNQNISLILIVPILVNLYRETLRPRLHGSGQIVARTKTCTVPPYVYTGPAELEEFLNG